MLTREQKRQFIHEGYIQLADAIPAPLVSAALRAVNHSIGHVGKTGGDPARHRSSFFCAELLAADVILDLYRQSSVMALAEEFLGVGNVLPVTTAKPYPRFPDAPEAGTPRLGGHIDGVGSGANGQPRGQYRRSFTLFAVIYLADVPETESGNFTVWPGSHRAFAQYFRRHGHQVLAAGTPRIDLPAGPKMLTGQAGDLILAHHQIYHAGGYNLSPRVRHAAIARLKHKDCDALGHEAYVDIWREWEGVRELVDA